MTDNKKRHGCLTAYLIVMIVANSGTALLYFFSGDFVRSANPNMPSWALPVLGIFGVFNLVCSFALFKLKKWGFYSFVISAVIVAFINVSIGMGIGSVIGGLLGVAILYGVLHIGKENKGWPQLY